MRRSSVLASVAVLGLIGCAEEDPPPLYVDISYQVRCIDCEPRAADDAVRNVRVVDGEAGFDVDCSVAERSGDRLLTFVATYTDPERESRNYGVSVRQAALDGESGGSCTVSVSEGNNTYEGRCSGDEPSDEAPCQVELEAEDGIVTGSLLCQRLPNKNTSTVTRHVVEPNDDGPAEFEVHGCRGL